MSHDYDKIGLKAGLEIHQQLNTSKLFCSCPSILRSDKPDYTIERKLNPVVGETGEIDIAAEYEKSKDQKFIYQVYDTVCLVELDEEPPHKINQKALKISLQIATLLNCKIFPVTQIMRKTVVNGSNTSGFQRTALIAHNGFIETSAGRVGIDYLFLEEDSARPASSKEEEDPELEKSKVYNLDRLGIPLVEIATGPHMHTPEQIKEAALKIGEILRACNVRRGIGTIRQDLNISIKGSKRVEIKGFQDPKMMIRTIDTEISRQQECVKEKSCKSEVRRANTDGTTTFLRPMPGSSRMYPETDVPLLKISRELTNEVKATLPKLASENRSYLDEFGLNEELVKLILKENKIEEFKTLNKVIEKPELIVKALTIFQKEISVKTDKSREEVEKILNIHTVEAILEQVGKKISENDVKTIMQKIVDGKSLDEAMEKGNIDLKEEIKKLIKDKPGLSQGAYMGLVMGKFKGQVSGKDVSDALKELM
ncbi:MAG: Glu-tRNA(Gln) amidotransferase subunit GatE [Candidatus Nanoarchaeia archaeon]